MSALCDRSIKNFCSGNMREWFDDNFKDLVKAHGNPYQDTGLVTPYSPAMVDDIALELGIGKTIMLIEPNEGDAFEVLEFHNGTYRSIVETGSKIDLTYYQNPRSGVTYRLRIPAHSCMLASTLEHVQIPPNCYGQIAVRSSYARQFLNHALSNIIQPTFCGDITLEFTTTNKAVEIFLDQPVIKMLLQEVQTPEVPYYARTTSRYMNQNNQLQSLMK